MTQEKALKLALEALEVSTDWDVNATGKQLKSMQAITALRKALAQTQEPVAWLITDEKINSLQVDFIQRLIDRARHAHMTDIKLRINGQDEWHQADWLKHLTRTTPPQSEQEPVAWQTMEAKYPTLEKLDIRMGDGSILCNVWPQSDGDLWWEGSGTGEKFIDPKYANVTHWRVHSDTTPPQRTEQNFCSRCGKRTKDIHTCTPPQEQQSCDKRTWVGLAKEDRLCAKYMQDAPEGIEAVIDYIESKLKELNT
jgi:hypothetical protein